jgi:hypothetical protein
MRFDSFTPLLSNQTGNKFLGLREQPRGQKSMKYYHTTLGTPDFDTTLPPASSIRDNSGCSSGLWSRVSLLDRHRFELLRGHSYNT